MTESKMLKIQALLDLAEHPNTPPEEAANARSKAEQMMVKYRIEEEMLRSERIATGTAEEPVLVEVPLCSMMSPYFNTYYNLGVYLAQHVGLKYTYKYAYAVTEDDGSERQSLVLQVVGFQSDIDYFQMLYTGVRVHFSSRMEPKYDPNESDEDNVYRLRNAGIERGRIALMMGWGGEGTNGPVRVTRTYKKACEARDEDPIATGKRNNMKSFRASFASQFLTTVYYRLQDMRRNSGAESAALVLRGRDEAVEESFYKHFPHLRPKPAIEDGYTGCEKCAKAKSGYCRTHAYRSSRYKEQPFNAAGARAGKRAGETADLSGGRMTGTRRLEA